MYFSVKTAVEFFCGFHVCHMEAVEFFGKHADKGVGAEEADRFFFYPIFICIGIAFFNGIQASLFLLRSLFCRFRGEEEGNPVFSVFLSCCSSAGFPSRET